MVGLALSFSWPTEHQPSRRLVCCLCCLSGTAASIIEGLSSAAQLFARALPFAGREMERLPLSSLAVDSAES
jgi:hypothetical protein